MEMRFINVLYYYYYYYYYYVCSRFLLHFITFFGVGLPAYFSNHIPFSREHIFVGFNEFPSLVLVHCHSSSPATGAYSFFKEWDGMLRVYSVMCAQTRDLLF